MSELLAPADASLECLVAQVLDEYRERQKRGERPNAEEYAARHPEAAPLLCKVLGALQLIEQSFSGAPLAGEAAGERLAGVLGDFELLREVGRGGMGIVYEAVQRSLRRRVALKVLPLAAVLDPRQLQRFHNEAQAAAGLHHTSIVPVYAVGSERGVHYYAMQFIDGQPLSALIAARRRRQYPQPDEAHGQEPGTEDHAPGGQAAAETPWLAAAVSTELSGEGPSFYRAVAGLGEQAARALEHAHQRGVIHRDVKPANLLVDEAGMLWVADFGLAQIQGDARLTMTGDLVGTLRYMSPEQAQARPGFVDHRTDIYALGATLYELLTLEPVFAGRDRHELMRQIAFEEPRSLRRLERAIPAELETIVQKALEKNPADRYTTARALADDLRRFLEHEPIRARRPGVSQRLRKWGRRHRGVVSTALAVGALALVGLVLGLAWHNRQLGLAAERERDLFTKAQGEARRAADLAVKAQEEKARAEAEKERAEDLNKFLLGDLLGQAAPNKNARQKQVTVEEVLDRAAANVEKSFAGRPDLEATVRMAIGGTYYDLGLFERARPQLERALALERERLGAEHPDTLLAANQVALVLKAQGKLAEAEPLLRQNLEAHRRVQGDEHPDTLRAVHNLAGLLRDQGKLAEAEPLYRRNLEALRRVKGPDHPETLIGVHNLSEVLFEQGKLTEAEQLCRQNLEARRRVLGSDHPDTLEAVNALAALLHDRGQLAELEPLLRQNLEARRRVLGLVHPNTLEAVNNLAQLLREQGKLAEAEPLFRQNVEGHRRVLGPDHPHTLIAVNGLARLLQDQGKPAEAEPLFRHTLEVSRRVLGPDHPGTLLALNNLANFLKSQGHLIEAEQLAHEALERGRKVLPPEHWCLVTSLTLLGDVLITRGRANEAEPLLREALRRRQKNLPPGHRSMAEAEGLLGACLLAQRHYAEAEPLLLAGYRGLEKTPGTQFADRARTCEWLVQLYEAWGKKDQADAWRKKLQAQRATLTSREPPKESRPAGDRGQAPQ
jgi:serine/threonine protein kinase/tetratricopeptide (TPR) repeat protein